VSVGLGERAQACRGGGVWAPLEGGCLFYLDPWERIRSLNWLPTLLSHFKKVKNAEFMRKRICCFSLLLAQHK